MKFNVITIFPELINSYFKEGVLKKAIDKNIFSLNSVNLRKYTDDKRQSVDDSPYGGGAGMLLKIEPLYKSLKDLKVKKGLKTKKIILLSASGKKWNQEKAKEFSRLKEITLICGRYEGVDNRIKEFIDEEISIGDYVLSGGELAALTIIDSTSRLLKNALGNNQSIIEESHSKKGIGEYPQYTKPEIFKFGKKELSVPKILLSGNHKEIEKWRHYKSKKID